MVQGNIILLLSLSLDVKLAMVTVIFSFLLTFLSLCSLSPVSDSFYLFLLFSILLPLFPDLS